MKREIKFRAWHRGYPSHHKLRSIPAKMLYDEKFGDCVKFKADGQPVELMQYTGLKDCLGQEIYEGDILEFDEYEWGNNINNKFVVRWDEANGEWNAGGGTNSECNEYKRVIGNIYENPDLITPNQTI